MIRIRFSIIAAISAVLFAACGQGEKKSGDDAVQETVMADPLNKDGIRLTEMVSPEFEDAVLTVQSPAEGMHFNDTARFEFGVENYELGSQTSDAAVKNCANSEKGQHIHLILNNAPYSAHYAASFDREVEAGHYIGLAFLSRSYHESIKTADAYKIFRFSTGDVMGTEAPEFDDGAPHMFYSRPKGTYNGADAEKVMLDFYLVNTDLSPEGNKVRATINGTPFTLDKWVPYFMEGLPDGETTIKLELLDASGNLIPGPFNTVERTVTVAK
jgi:hypothetical protein